MADRPPPLLADVARSLARHPPFDELEPALLARLAAGVSLAFHPRGATVASPDAGVADRLYIVKQGCVVGGAGNALGPGECFPVEALVGRRAPDETYRAERDTFCWELPAPAFHELLERSARFRAYCTDHLAALLERVRRAQRGRAAESLAEGAGMLAPLGSLLARAPVWCVPEASLAQVLETMHKERVGAMVVCDIERKPLGILTTHDVLHRVAAAHAALDQPVSMVMTPAPVTLEDDVPIVEAALAMARHGFRHVLVTSAGRLHGVVSERDLFAMQRFGLARIASSLRAAGSLGALAEAAAGIRRLSKELLAQGIDAEHLTQLTSALYDSLARRLIELVAPNHVLPARWCWLALGSEGRLEQTLATDQDNALLFEAPGGTDAARAALLGFADEVNRGLAACGIPLCPGDIMARNPRWCLTQDEWRRAFDQWIRNPQPEALLNAAIFFDFRPVAGDAALAGELRQAVLAQAGRNPAFVRALADNALRVRPPLGLLGDISTDDNARFPGTLDLKGYGTRPLVDAARTMALKLGIAATGTAARLRAAAAAGALPAAEAAAAVDALHYLQGLRLRRQHLEGELPVGAENRIDPARLNEVDRRILKAAFRQSAALQDRLRADYLL